MNMQAMLKQAQKMQKDMMNSKEEIDNMTFVGKASLVTVEMKGTKELTKVSISPDFEPDEIDMLEDMILVAVNDASKQVDKTTEEKMGRFTQGMPGLF